MPAEKKNHDDEKPSVEDEGKGEIVEFPADAVHVPPQRLPQPIGRIEPGHPLRRPLTIAIIALFIFLLIVIVSSFFSSAPYDQNDQDPFTQMYHESGAITYDGDIIEGWFLDTERQHFMDVDGNRYTYVDSHTREDAPVSGHWRLIE